MRFSILIELPPFIKKELSRLQVGLPNAEWNEEENLYISLYIFKKLSDLERWNIVEKLGEIDLSSFSIKIQGLDYLSNQKSKGFLLAQLAPSQELNTLRKKIDGQLRSFHLNNLENRPMISLGILQKESTERILRYFEANGEFASSSFKIQDFIFAQLHQSSKRSFYTVEKRYFLE